MKKDIYVFKNKVYPIVSKALDKNEKKFDKFVEKFISDRAVYLYDTAPCDRILFSEEDKKEFFKILEINEKDITNEMSNLYYWKLAFRPLCAKDELTMCILCVIRYYVLNKRNKTIDNAMLYLAFSGKMYPSLHYQSFPKAPPSQYRHIMDYTVNNKLNNSFDLKKYGTVIESIKSKNTNWVTRYSDRFNTFDDEDCVYMIQQIRDRIASFIINIAENYYEAYEENKYISYDSDDVSEENWRLADNLSFKAERNIESSMDYIVNNNVDFKLIKMASATTIKYEELATIIESIISIKGNIPIIKELVSILVYEFYKDNPTKNISDIKFIADSIKAKPNTKNKNIIRLEEIIVSWLDENSPLYRKRKSRLQTKLAYHKGVLFYFALLIQKANK